MRPDHDEFEDLVAGLVLGALEPEEAARARAHLESCAACQELAGRLSTSVAALPLAAEEVQQPPAGLRQRILAEAAASRATPARAPARPRRRRLPRFPRLPAGRPSQFRPARYRVAIAVLGAGLLALAGWNAYLSRSLNQPPAHYSMAGTGSMAGSQASVTSYGREDLTLVSFRGMAQPEPGRVYQLWLIGADGRPLPAAVFTPDARGDYQLVVTRNLEGVDVLAVTQEQGPDGASQPTQQPQFTGRVTT